MIAQEVFIKWGGIWGSNSRPTKSQSGKSNLIVILTYLRGLESSELKVDDMPIRN